MYWTRRAGHGCSLLVALLPLIQRLLQKYVNHIHPRSKFPLCKCVQTLDHLLWESDAEHHAALRLLHIMKVLACSAVCQPVTNTIYYYCVIAVCS